MVSLAQDRITIMPGGGLRSSNIQEIEQTTNATYFHSSALTYQGEICDIKEINRLKSLIN